MTSICPIAWQSKRARRVVKSTLTAETLAIVDTAEACIFHRKLLLEILQVKDNIDNIILREMLETKEITEISWVPTDTQIADSLTKKGVPSFKILGFMSELKESSV